MNYHRLRAALPSFSAADRAPPRTAYRSEIDGLRALAVVPVVLYHAGFAIFSRGFVGVDVFFVISGYLITRRVADFLL
jgi:peptidoglycan/LPS O-acetylase OafA/YrhL